MAGMSIVTVSTDASGNINMKELKEKAEANSKNLAALMITYPSTYGEPLSGVCPSNLASRQLPAG